MEEPNDTTQETLEESMERLETILDTLEVDDISLEDSFALYQKGMKLVQSCREKIDTVEKKILIMNGDGGLDEF